MGNNRGFLVLEILIAGLILTSSIAASMYLFKMGFEYLQRANESNLLSSKLPDALNMIKVTAIEQGSGTERLGDDVTLQWQATLIEKTRPKMETFEGPIISAHEIYLYKVDFSLQYKDIKREYETRAVVFRQLVSGKDFMF
jgi:hypothetical protein